VDASSKGGRCGVFDALGLFLGDFLVYAAGLGGGFVYGGLDFFGWFFVDLVALCVVGLIVGWLDGHRGGELVGDEFDGGEFDFK
jgi:hypothetical protein